VEVASGAAPGGQAGTPTDAIRAVGYPAAIDLHPPQAAVTSFYLFAALGPGLIAPALLEEARGRLSRVFEVFGGVPRYGPEDSGFGPAPRAWRVDRDARDAVSGLWRVFRSEVPQA